MYSFPNLESLCCSMYNSNCFFLTSYRFCRRQVRWFGILITLKIFQFVVIHTVKGFRVVNKAEVDVFLESSWFFYHPVNIGNLISGSSAFSKSSLSIWLLKPGLENFKHYFAIIWNECTYTIVEQFLPLHFFGIEMKTDLFQSYGHCWVFQICWHIGCSTFTASFRILNSSTGIPYKGVVSTF